MVGMFVRAGIKKFLTSKKGGVEAITGVKPKLTKGESLEVLRHKTKAAIKKGTDDITDAITTGKNKIIKSLNKMKDPKK